MSFLWYSLLSAAVVAADQIVKYLVVENIPLYQDITVLPGVVGLTYVQNNGAAFSLLQGRQWVFMVVFVVFTAVVLWEYFRKPLPLTRFERFCIAAVYGGGVGNMIDRVRMGYVVDMIETKFIDFPVFNVADFFITCGCIALLVSLIFFIKEFWKDGK